ncbi:MAG: class I tRNA ligase family protein, partial [Gammaproteobacteria bacterium]|nr:class I tRNA ligase family protein [Gammaproteobacteria bacterium]
MQDYKDTLNLPKTNFPMKAGLAQREPEMLKFWNELDLYKQLCDAGKEREKFILHDGPPYANGKLHQGHALNKILKDIVIKSKWLSGLAAPYVPGWDCHGLPIEINVEKKLGKAGDKVSKEEFIEACRKYAGTQVEIQREGFKRLGIFGAWESPYLTMDYKYEADVMRALAKIIENGHLARGSKPVHWCAACGSALAEAEVEYQDSSSPSIYVKFPLISDISEAIPSLKGKNVYVIIWTTTPWTIPANLAICFHPDFTYAAVEAKDEVYIIAEGLLLRLLAELEIEQYKILDTFPGSTLEGFKCRHPFIDRESLLILGNHVTLEAGTGCVHTAPGHGQEDYEMGLKYNLDIYTPVDDDGKFTSDVDFFAGEFVFKANKAVNQKLKEVNALLKEETITHSYPHCWRCKNPIVFRSTRQWFINVEHKNLRKKALKALRNVQWLPEGGGGESRISSMIKTRPDWCLSRQRLWGVPI